MNSLPQDDPKRKAFIAKVKKLNQEKKDHEKDLHKKVKKTGVDQELAEGRGDMDDIKSIISDRAAESGFEEREEAAEIIAAIAEEYMLSLKVIQAYMDSDGPVNPQDVYEAELSKKERSKLKDIVKQLKKSVKGHDAQQKYISTLVKEDDKEIAHDCANHVMHLEHGPWYLFRRRTHFIRRRYCNSL